MSAADLIPALRSARVVPVIRHQDPTVVTTGCTLLAEAGFSVLEITFTVPGAADVIASLRAKLPRVLIGAGTVLTVAQAEAAVDAGAAFLVAPCWTDEAATTAHAARLPYLPGAATPGEVLHHWQAGAAVVKVFPAREAGGPGFLKALRAVFPDIPLMPTGGVKPADVPSYLAAGAVCTGLGGELFPATALEAEDLAAARNAIRDAWHAVGLNE